jgi:WNK lysine deficient protein kinase
VCILVRKKKLFVGVDHHHWYALSDNDDDMSSVHSGKYSPLHYASGADEAAETMPTCCTGSSKTRFGGGRSAAAQLARQLQRQCSMSVSPQHAGRPRRREDDDDGTGTSRRRRMTRNRSMVDMRSQLLHRTLVEELNRRLFFNTVGAVENIGFRAPTTTSPSASSSSVSAAARGRGGLDHRGRRGGGNGKQQLDDKQQYFML